MKLIFEMNFGYVTCDIHGDGYNRIWVYRDDWAPLGSQWRAVLSSRCYGDDEKLGLNTEGLIEYLEANRFFVATRRARYLFNRFVEGMRLGKFDKDEDGWEPRRPVVRATDSDYTVRDEFRCMDICCNPVSEDELLYDL